MIFLVFLTLKVSHTYIFLKIIITTCNRDGERSVTFYNFMNLDNMIFLPVRKVREGKYHEEEKEERRRRWLHSRIFVCDVVFRHLIQDL